MKVLSRSFFAPCEWNFVYTHAMNEEQTGRTVPHNSDVEAGILGAILRDNEQFSNLSSITAEMFYVPGHKKLWELIKRQIDAGNPATPATLKYQAGEMPELEGLGGAEYLARLTFEEFSIISPKRYGEILIDLYRKREIITICQEGIHAAMDSEADENAHDISNRTETRLFGLDSTSQTSRTYSLAEASEAALEDIADIADGKADKGVPTGFNNLKTVMGGMRRSDLLILAARPAMGKTSLAMNIAFHAAKFFHHNRAEGKKEQSVLFFSLEMSAQQLSTRILSDQANIKFEKIRLSEVDQKEYNQYHATHKEIRKYPLYIEENPNVNIAEMRAIMRKVSRQNPVGLVILDYLQLLSSHSNKRDNNRVQELSEITRGLKILAREFDVPIMALSQLSRGVESRDNKTPNLSDLRDSGSIEQDADMVLFLYRPEYYLKPPELKDNESPEAYQKREDLFQSNKDKLHGVAKVIIAKNRHGAPATVNLQFHHELIRFTDPIFAERNYQNEDGIPKE